MEETLQSLGARIGALIDEQWKKIDGRFNKVDARFDKVDAQFDKVDERFDKVDEQFDRVDGRFNEVDERFGNVDQRFGNVDQRFGSIDQHLKRIDQQLDKSDARFVAMERQISDVKSHLTIKIDELKGNVQLVLERFDDFVTKDEANISAHQQFGERIEDHDLRITDLENSRPPSNLRRKKAR